jgi:GxxExxY protein
VPEETYKFAELTKRTIGVFYDVYNELGHGFLESVYEQAMMIALKQEGLNTSRQVGVPVWFRGFRIGDYKVDLMVEDAVLLELKTARVLENIHEAQVLHYLKSTPIKVGSLLNFGPSPEVRRFVFDNKKNKISENLRESAVKISA